MEGLSDEGNERGRRPRLGQAQWAGAAALIAALALAIAPARADIYDLDPEHTEVRFSWDHLGLSRQSGRFTDLKGVVNFNASNPATSTVEVTIPLQGIQTGVKKLDEHLLTSREFFNPDTHPNITFKSVSVTPTGQRTAEVTGELSINGIARPVVLDVIWNFSGEHPLSSINPTYAGVYASGFSAKTSDPAVGLGINADDPVRFGRDPHHDRNGNVSSLAAAGCRPGRDA